MAIQSDFRARHARGSVTVRRVSDRPIVEAGSVPAYGPRLFAASGIGGEPERVPA
jgi:hypothetical protein